ncbi:hypothetical protein BDV29DRAFT_200685 [Aspergillus leporis]|uniref:Zn(2)-C6 fungal-type domain-containing protein n=1 Tax=Aspergillus leporis TaxID=41062 RepID=A0A5N5X970_9EURO|nr:hypothetical protein BDV29DRAFT_200685 [Aspergillus leporis]
MVSAEQLAPQVCVTCKMRKKKWDKVLQFCGYCNRKRLDCQYASQLPLPTHATPSGKDIGLECVHPLIRSSLLLIDPISDLMPSEMFSLGALMDLTGIDTTLYLQACRIIQKTNQFVDDISVRYFQGIYGLVPIISRKPSFSALLLSICLVTYYPDILPQRPQPVCRQSLYFAKNERPKASQSIGEEEEATNTWWGIVILERLFFCDLSTPDQPFATEIPSYTELGTILEYAARAAWLLDQIIENTKISDLDTLLIKFDELDGSLQSFLGILMEECHGVWLTWQHASYMIGSLPQSCIYVTWTALKHIHNSAGSKNEWPFWETDKD